MKYISVLLGVLVLFVCSSTAMAQNSITGPFCLEKEVKGYYIPPGSVVHHFANGSTIVQGPDGKVIARINDFDSSMIQTPAGKIVPATYVFTVPSGSVICSRGNITKVYKDGRLILTVIGSNKGVVTQVPAAYNGWLEDAENWSISTLRYFDAYWNVPTPPPNPESTTINYLFNAIEPNTGTSIIQPVLEWNFDGSNRWTAAAWAGPDASGNYFRSYPINVNTGDTLHGEMTYGVISGYWLIGIKDTNTGEYSGLYSNLIGSKNLSVFVALEGYDVYDNTDVPGDTLFYQMSLYDSSWNPISVKWTPWVYVPLPGLDVKVYSSTTVELETAN